MKVGEIKVESVFYNEEENKRTPICQIFKSEHRANTWIEWLKTQEDVISITATKQMEYGEEVFLCWW